MDNFLQTIGAINDETRVKILNFINIHGEVCVCDIEKESFNRWGIIGAGICILGASVILIGNQK